MRPTIFPPFCNARTCARRVRARVFGVFTWRRSSGHARGNDTAEAHLAGLMRQHGVSTIYSRNRGYRRYPGIKVHDPISHPVG